MKVQLPTKGTPGTLGSLLVLDSCKSKNKIQTWTIDNKLPSGKKFAGYQSISHKVDNKTRCLSASGNDTVRKLISRDCADDSDQKFAVTDYGEIRQMGRCLTSNHDKKLLENGYELDFQECNSSKEQKWSYKSKGLIQQTDKHSSVRCISEGPTFGVSIPGLPNMPKVMKDAMAKMPSFALVASQLCTLNKKDAKSWKIE